MMDKLSADRALFEFADAAEELGVVWFLALGTCLGMVRDGGYIEGDNDIDLGVVADRETLSRFFDALMARGFSPGNTHLNPGGERNQHFKKGGVLIDVFYTFRRDTEPFLLFFDRVAYGGREFNVPHPVEEYLASEFGDWRTPAPEKSRGPAPMIEYLDFEERDA